MTNSDQSQSLSTRSNNVQWPTVIKVRAFLQDLTMSSDQQCSKSEPLNKNQQCPATTNAQTQILSTYKFKPPQHCKWKSSAEQKERKSVRRRRRSIRHEGMFWLSNFQSNWKLRNSAQWLPELLKIKSEVFISSKNCVHQRKIFMYQILVYKIIMKWKGHKSSQTFVVEIITAIW